MSLVPLLETAARAVFRVRVPMLATTMTMERKSATNNHQHPFTRKSPIAVQRDQIQVKMLTNCYRIQVMWMSREEAMLIELML